MTMTDTTAVTEDVDLSRLVASADTIDEAMRAMTHHVAVATPAADAAGLTIATASGFRTCAATAPLADTVDALQYRLGGPCVDVLADPEPVLYLRDIPAQELDPTSRWHHFAAAAHAHTPVRSLLSFRLHVAPDPPLASLNLYATAPDAFTCQTVTATAQLLASAAVALAYQRERRTRQELQTALETNRRIAAAVGVLMARRLVEYDTALALLRHASQDANRKMRDVADEVLTAGELPHITARNLRPARRENAPGGRG